jgi:hypothetical protein
VVGGLEQGSAEGAGTVAKLCPPYRYSAGCRKAMACSVCVCVVLERGEGAEETQDPLDASRYGRVRGDHRSEHRFEACGDTIAGKGGVEAGIKPSKGGCCRSTCEQL